MAELTIEQQKAIAIARARRARSEAEQPSTGMDMLKSGLTGLRSGVERTVGMAGDANKMQGDVIGWAAEKLGVSPETAGTIGNAARYISPLPMSPTTEEIQNVTTPVLGEGYKPQTVPGEYARTVGEFAPAIIGGPGGLMRRAITQVALPAIGSETAGQFTKGTTAEPYARIAGALAGGMLPSIASRMISPNTIDPNRHAMIDALKREGVDLTAGQQTGSQNLRNLESELGGTAGQRMMENQGEQFTAAALKRIGANANRATPEVLDDAYAAIGQQFDDLAARNQIIPDPQFGQDLGDTLRDYSSTVAQSQRAPIVEDLVADLTAKASQGPIDGNYYQQMASRIAAKARGTADNDLRSALNGIRNSLDDAMERTMQAHNPADLGGWQEARKNYRNFLVIEKAATGAGADSALGLISPSQLRNATVQKQGLRSYARGDGDFGELARAGEAMMKPLPNSGTAGRTWARNLGHAVPSVIGGLAGSPYGATGAIAGMALGAAAPPLAGRALLSGPVQSYLTNQAATGLRGADPRRLAVISALLSHRGE